VPAQCECQRVECVADLAAAEPLDDLEGDAWTEDPSPMPAPALQRLFELGATADELALVLEHAEHRAKRATRAGAGRVSAVGAVFDHDLVVAVDLRLAADPERLIAQPWVEGEPLSLSLVCDHGVARLLSCNRQQIGIEDGRLSVEGLLVNALPDEGNFAVLAGRLAEAIPGLWGYVGVDLVLTRDGPVILEINPRLTTSYCGLGRALGINTGAMVLSLLGRDPGTDDWPLRTTGTTVEILLEASNSI